MSAGGARFDVAVVGRAHEAAAVAAAVASTLATRSSSRTALVVGVGERPPGPGAPPTPHARRLRERLLTRDLQAHARGRIVWCLLAADAGDPAPRAYRAAAAAGPVVLAICGARAAWVEPLLEQASIVLVAGDPADPLSALALAGLHARGVAAISAAAPVGVGAALARIGLGRPGSWPVHTDGRAA